MELPVVFMTELHFNYKPSCFRWEKLKPCWFRPVVISLEVCLVSRKSYVVSKSERGVILSESSPVCGGICPAVLFLSGLWLHIGHCSVVLSSYPQGSSTSMCWICLFVCLYLFISVCLFMSLSANIHASLLLVPGILLLLLQKGELQETH